MDAVHSSEMSVSVFETTRRHIPEGSTPQGPSFPLYFISEVFEYLWKPVVKGIEVNWTCSSSKNAQNISEEINSRKKLHLVSPSKLYWCFWQCPGTGCAEAPCRRELKGKIYVCTFHSNEPVPVIVCPYSNRITDLLLRISIIFETWQQ
jgi:hypothetical protein